MNNDTPLFGSPNNLHPSLLNNHDQTHYTNEIGLNCYLLNARSICNKLDEFQALVFGENLDVVAVTETWLKPDIYDGEILPGNQYTIYRRDRADGRRGGDLLLCNHPDDVSDLSITQDIFDSDHFGISFRILTKVSRLSQIKRVIYNFKNANFDGLREALCDISWDDCFLDSDNINNSLEKWMKLFYSIVDQFVQKKCVSNINRSPWVDREIVLLLKKKNTLRRKAKSRDTVYLWAKFRRLRAEIKKLIKHKKKAYISNLGQDLKSNPKRFWSYYKALNKTNRISNTISYGNITATDSISKANIFNTFFHSTFNACDNSIYITVSHPLNDSMSVPCLSNITLDSEDVLKALHSLDIHKASCGIPSKLLKECSNAIATPLTRLFNESLSTGEFPSQWKDANLVPIHKTGRKSQATNYRGISLLEQLSKIFEKGVYNVVFEFFSNKITTSQHGFYPRRSCATQLTQVVHLLAQSMDNKQQVDLVYLDFAKAFDRVPHSKLICKLHLLGIRDPLLSWFRSYLYKRRHRVVIGGFASEWLPVTSGVPQGSVLGPLLFLLYINDMPEVISQGSYLPLFADDSKCFRVIFNASDQDRLQEDLNALYDWSIKWGMEFNVEKCKVLRVVRTRTIYDRQYALGSSHLSVVQSEKDLGVWISDTLNWNIHTDNIVAKAQKMLGLLYRTLKDIDDNSVKRLLYFTWVRPTLEYASPVWSPYKKRNINKIEKTMLSEKCFWKMYVQKHFDLGIKSDLSNEGPMAQWSGPVWTANGKVEPQSDGTWECLFSEDEEDDDDIYLIRPFPSMWNCRVFHPYGLDPFSGDVRSLQGFSRSLEILTYMRSEASRLGMHSESTWDEDHEICAVIFPWDKQELPTTLELLNGVFHFHPEIYNHYADLSPEGYSTLNENMLIFHIPQDVGLIHDCAIRPCLNSIFGVSAPKTDEPWRLRDSRAFYEWLQPIMCPSFTAYVGDDVFSPMALYMLTQLAPGWVGGALTSGD
ncbi:Hypothetical predicted protein [Paramuricea clavata]|uniref:Uncharacterized protein n=1 Tax=Paramuricea clavata TaxID=317549 RepID=A0A7D9DH73_PARCT|nr:Hypothetical predicted protein [Paramuricea clavata]